MTDAERALLESYIGDARYKRGLATGMSFAFMYALGTPKEQEAERKANEAEDMARKAERTLGDVRAQLVRAG